MRLVDWLLIAGGVLYAALWLLGWTLCRAADPDRDPPVDSPATREAERIVRAHRSVTR